MAKIIWTSDLLDELYREKMQGKTLSDLSALVFSKLGIKITPARISQVLTHYKNNEEVPF